MLKYCVLIWCHELQSAKFSSNKDVSCNFFIQLSRRRAAVALMQTIHPGWVNHLRQLQASHPHRDTLGGVGGGGGASSSGAAPAAFMRGKARSEGWQQRRVHVERSSYCAGTRAGIIGGMTQRASAVTMRRWLWGPRGGGGQLEFLSEDPVLQSQAILPV